MNRRGFLGVLAAACVLDPERALWVPGARLISVPAPRPGNCFISVDEFTRWYMVTLNNNLDLARAEIAEYRFLTGRRLKIGDTIWLRHPSLVG